MRSLSRRLCGLFSIQPRGQQNKLTVHAQHYGLYCKRPIGDIIQTLPPVVDLCEWGVIFPNAQERNTETIPNSLSSFLVFNQLPSCIGYPSFVLICHSHCYFPNSGLCYFWPGLFLQLLVLCLYLCTCICACLPPVLPQCCHSNLSEVVV